MDYAICNLLDITVNSGCPWLEVCLQFACSFTSVCPRLHVTNYKHNLLFPSSTPNLVKIFSTLALQSVQFQVGRDINTHILLNTRAKLKRKTNPAECICMHTKKKKKYQDARTVTARSHWRHCQLEISPRVPKFQQNTVTLHPNLSLTVVADDNCVSFYLWYTHYF